MCKGTFNNYIQENIFSKQTQDAFATDSSKKLLRKTFWLYLFHRTLVPLDADPLIPTAINAMISYLQDHRSEGPALLEKEMREILCKTVGKSTSMDELGFELGGWGNEENRHEPAILGSYHRILPGQDVGHRILDPAFLAAAAAAIGDVALMEEALSNLDSTLVHAFRQSLFGDIIANSVAFDHPEVLEAFSNFLDRLHRQPQVRLNASVSHYNWELLVIDSIKKGADLWVKQLLEFALKHCSRSHNGWKFCQALVFAIDNCNGSMIINLLDSGKALVESGTQFNLDVGKFARACAWHDEDVVLPMAKLLEGGVNHIWRNSTVLTLAVQHGRASTVAALVDAGAWVDGRSSSMFQGTSKFRTIVVPIEEAMKRGNCGTIQALLDRGATVADLKIHSRKRAVYNLLRDAKMMETSEYVPTYAEKYGKAKTQAPDAPPPSILSDRPHSTAIPRRLAAPSTSATGYVGGSGPSPADPPQPMTSPLFPLDLGGAHYDISSPSLPLRLHSTSFIGPIDPSSIDMSGYVRDDYRLPDDPPREYAFVIAPPNLGGGIYYESSSHPPRQHSAPFLRPINPSPTGMTGHAGGNVHPPNPPAPAYPSFNLAEAPYDQFSTSYPPPPSSCLFMRPQ
jgi:hypothetical protein